MFMFLLVLYENTLPFLKNKTHIHNAHSYEKHVISTQDYRQAHTKSNMQNHHKQLILCDTKSTIC